MHHHLTEKNIDRAFVSAIDRQLDQFNNAHARSASEQAEILKYQHINTYRDHPTPLPTTETMWD